MSTGSIQSSSWFTMRIFIELVGDKHVGEINHDDCDSFVRALSIWPANATKRLMFRELAAPDVLRAAMKYRTPPLHLRTQQKHVDRMRCFFKYLENRREIEPNLLKGVRLYSRGKMMSKSRYPFPEELLTPMFQKLHASKLRQPFMYWAPILALYQGMRINEIGQLYVDDVFCDHDIWYLRLTDNNPEQRLKNVHSRRVLPLRQEVLECGFLDLVEQARSWGRTTLFADDALPFQLGLEDLLGSTQHIVLGGAAGELVVALAIANEAHVVFSLDAECAVGTGRRSGKRPVAPGASACAPRKAGTPWTREPLHRTTA